MQLKKLTIAALLGVQAVAAATFGSTPLAFAAPAKVPSVDVMQGFPDVETINVAEYCAGKNVIIVGLPGAFTPTWSATQVPGYLESQEALKEAGVEEVIVYCVNDPAVSKYTRTCIFCMNLSSNVGTIAYQYTMWYLPSILNIVQFR